MTLKLKNKKLKEELNSIKAKLESAELELRKVKAEKEPSLLKNPVSNNSKEFVISDDGLDLSQQAFLQLFETMVQGFALHKMIYKEGKAVDFEYIIINKAFEDLTGLKRDKVISKSVLEILPSTESIWIENYAKVAETGQSIHFENFSKELNKTYNVVAYCPKKGYFASVFTDVTETKNTELNLIAAKEAAEVSSKLKTMFLNNMSHEIRTPLNVIIGFTNLLGTKKNIPEKQRDEYNKMIIEGGDQLVKVIEDILEISSLETQKSKAAYEPFSINELLDEVVYNHRTKSEEKNLPIHIHKTFEHEQSFIVSDKVKIHKILKNIVSNALKYTEEGSIDISYEVKDCFLEFSIKDTGIGIKNTDQRFIFERFTQESNETNKLHSGLGIGLAIAKENIDLLKGTISYVSEVNMGTTFSFVIPYIEKILQQNNEDIKQDEVKEKVQIKKKYSLLIAEDEALNFKFLEILLGKSEKAEFKCIRAHNGQEAIKICDSNEHIDLVLMDIQMPILDGNEAAKQLKEKYPDLPIIAQSAYSGRVDIEKALNHGCDDYIAKPIDTEILFKKIYSALQHN